MNITTAQVKEIRLALAKMKPVKATLDGNRSLTVKEAVFALAPTLERMKKRGFDTQEIAEKLLEKGIEIKPPTLAKYLMPLRRKPTDSALSARANLSLRRTRRMTSCSHFWPTQLPS